MRSIVDTSEARRALKLRLAREREADAAVKQELLNLGRRRFSEIGELSPGSFGLLMDLVGAATDARRPNSTTSTGASREGHIRIEIDWAARIQMAAIETSGGTMHLADAVFTVTSTRS